MTGGFPASDQNEPVRALFVGRFVHWKGAQLAIRTMRHVRHPHAQLRLYGSGPERDRLEQVADDWQVSDRIRFEGRLPRSELLQRLVTAGVVLHTSLRGSGLSVAESLSLGAPVVCLDQGEASAILDCWPNVPRAPIAPDSPECTAQELAQAIDRILADPPSCVNEPIPPSPTFADALLRAYEEAAATR